MKTAETPIIEIAESSEETPIKADKVEGLAPTVVASKGELITIAGHEGTQAPIVESGAPVQAKEEESKEKTNDEEIAPAVEETKEQEMTPVVEESSENAHIEKSALELKGEESAPIVEDSPAPVVDQINEAESSPIMEETSMAETKADEATPVQEAKESVPGSSAPSKTEELPVLAGFTPVQEPVNEEKVENPIPNETATETSESEPVPEKKKSGFFHDLKSKAAELIKA